MRPRGQRTSEGRLGGRVSAATQPLPHLPVPSFLPTSQSITADYFSGLLADSQEAQGGVGGNQQSLGSKAGLLSLLPFPRSSPLAPGFLHQSLSSAQSSTLCPVHLPGYHSVLGTALLRGLWAHPYPPI